LGREFTIKDEQQVRDFVRGCAFYGTGGGGSPDYGVNIMLKTLRRVKRIKVTPVSGIRDGSWTVCAYGMGSIAPRTPAVLEEMKKLGLTRVKVPYKLADATRELESHEGKKIDVIVPLEIGGANTPDPVATAAFMGIDAVDGDYSGGRAIPEIIQTGAHLAGVPMAPLASVDEWGNRVLIKEAVNNLVAEKIGKLVSILAYGNLAGNATYLVRGSKMKKLVTPGTVSRAFETGRKIREIKEERGKMAEALSSHIEGYFLFQGKIVKKEDTDHDGYYWGTNTVKGAGRFSGHTFKYFYKNENHVTWLDEKPFVTSPDIVAVIDSVSGEPITNPKSRVGDSVSVYGMKSDKRFRTAAALDVLGPRHFGFAYDFSPIEELHGRC
jgi:DUF917 family protein